jgi:uncharacterized membrane protein
MGERVKYPRVLAAVRVGIYAVATVLAAGVAGITAASLGVLLAISGVALVLNGTVDVLAIAGIAGLVIVLLGLLLGGLVMGVRRVDRAVQEAARRPDPVERLKQQYVNAEVDEAEFENRLGRLLGGSPPSTGRSPAEDARTDDDGGERETEGPIRITLL